MNPIHIVLIWFIIMLSIVGVGMFSLISTNDLLTPTQQTIILFIALFNPLIIPFLKCS